VAGLKVVVDCRAGRCLRLGAGGVPAGRRRGRRDRRRTATARASTTAPAPPTSSCCRRRSWSTAPTSAWPTTADADRCLAVDATGAVVDGDQLLALLAVGLADRGALPTRTVVATS
jgi:hypothetical protein